MTAPTAMPVCGLTLETFTAAVHMILSPIGIAEGFGVMTSLLADRERASSLSASPCARHVRRARTPTVSSESWGDGPLNGGSSPVYCTTSHGPWARCATARF